MTCNVILLGAPGTGKSSFINVLKGGDVIDIPTLGVDFQPFQKWRFWDSAGQERFRSVARGYYRKADVALIFFCANKPETYQAALEWETDFMNYSDVPVILVANKSDLQRAKNVINISCLKKEGIEELIKLLPSPKRKPRVLKKEKERNCNCY